MENDLKELLRVRKDLEEMKSSYEKVVAPILSKEHELKAKILESMKSSGELSKRYETATLTRTVKKTPKVMDEKRVIGWLSQDEGLYNEYTDTRLKDEFDGFLKEAMKENKEIDGVQIFESEYLSIRAK